jgi:integrase
MCIFVETKTDKMKEYLELKDKANQNFITATKMGDVRFHLLVILALETGARVSDLLKIKAEDFTKENGVYYLSYYNTKGKKKQVQKVSEKTALKVDMITNGISTYGVFYNESKGTIMSRITANRKCTALYGFNFHNLRKVAGKNVATQKGVVYASKFLGHSRVSTTDIYLGVSTDQFKKDMEDCII